MDQASWQLISQGAEARVFGLELFGMPAVAKHRFSKRYRVAELDERLRRERTVHEVRCVRRARHVGVAVPAVLMVDQHVIYFERILGPTAKDFVDENGLSQAVRRLMSEIGEAVARLHDNGITHGDLTTSNFLCLLDENKLMKQLFVIDFGLGSMRPQVEDKAVDLYVLERALVSTHVQHSKDLLEIVLEAYAKHSTAAAATLKRLDAVRARGRKRDCFG